MSVSGSTGREGLRYQPDERVSPGLALALGLQITVLAIAGIILIPTIVMRAGGANESYLAWAVFATVAICGATTVLHAVRVWRIGTGSPGGDGTPPESYIAVCATAVADGRARRCWRPWLSPRPPCRIVLAARLPLFQRLLTPTVSANGD